MYACVCVCVETYRVWLAKKANGELSWGQGREEELPILKICHFGSERTDKKTPFLKRIHFIRRKDSAPATPIFFPLPPKEKNQNRYPVRSQRGFKY